ncbi:hypothetical protein GCM10023178_08300 [Actinomadura luteofluorescens]
MGTAQPVLPPRRYPVFEHADIDPAKLQVTTMRGLKRTVRRHGPVRGHRAGLDSDRLLDYVTARRLIYLPSYRWVLDHRVTDLLERLRQLSDRAEVVLLDYTTNGDLTDVTKPLSHAALIRQYIERPAERPAQRVFTAG